MYTHLGQLTAQLLVQLSRAQTSASSASSTSEQLVPCPRSQSRIAAQRKQTSLASILVLT